MLKRFCLIVLLIVVTGLLGGCSSTKQILGESSVAYVVYAPDSLAARHAPIIVTPVVKGDHDRLGSPAAREISGSKERIYIDPDRPVFFVMEQSFKTGSAEYTNLLYRVHFERVPFPRLTAGRNVGIFVIITLNASQQPVLVTTVHTCGCFLAVMPTTYLAPEAWPVDWDRSWQKINGEKLPGLLQYPETMNTDYRPAIWLRSGNHRVIDVRIENIHEAHWRYRVAPSQLQSMHALKRIPVEGADRQTSFFYEQGRRKGFVKNSKKPLERLFMSWWAFDAYIGRDKELGDHAETGTTFFTDIYFWNRKESDLWPFARVLSFYGWRL